VLDFGNYVYFHPGGKFTIKKNAGRDVTKFFNGAYRLSNGKDGDKQLNHSIAAQVIANSLVVGYLQGQESLQPVRVRVE
jgi:cytochrome b involved in lipid metabolism